MSNYNYGLEPGIRQSGSSRLRFVLIFLAVSALTAALLWWFWPNQNKDGKEISNTSAAPSQEQKQEVKTAPVAKDPQPIREPEISPVTPAAEDAAKKEEKSPSAGKAVAEKKETKNVDPTDPVLPPKGVVTESDKKGVDLPDVPVDNVVSDAQKKALEQAAELLAAKDYAGAEKFAEQALENTVEYSDFYRKTWRILSDARIGMAFNGKSNPYVIRYRIRSGDSLSGVAGRFFTTVELLRKRNNISGSRIFVGKQLYVVPGDWKIIVSKKFRLLKLYRVTKEGEKLFALWEVGIGRMDKTPVAEFAIAARVRHPDWFLPDGRVFKYGDAENQLGEYFLKLAPASAPGRPLLGYGIHGAKDESTVGRSLSNGCIRMRNADVENLYYLVPAGCRVNIVEK